ncbi:hypothetical protein OsJ_36187 [Oryza sativa Japonica Group]|uniref:DUF8040 domain-containing protein n=1 Tax=Oryza sativa subsp. japonica TaxID=39947 RepID=B9GDA0_ORYSJ|nr:hypothetical protein OsJ_36187 [Oryza sativa Japonica Group]
MNCLVAYRMEPEVFKSTAEFLRRKNLVRDTRGVRVEEKLAMFMYMLSHNASYQDMQYEFKHSGATIHLHIRAFFDIVPTLTHRFIKPPLANQTHSKITSNPRFYPYFKSFPRAKKFRNKPFPIFEALGELYDGQTAEGLLNFTSLQPTNTLDQSRNTEDDIVTQVGADDLLMENNQDDLNNDDPITASEQSKVEVSNQLNQRRQTVSTSRKPPEDKREKNPKRHKQNGNVADAMEKYIEL